MLLSTLTRGSFLQLSSWLKNEGEEYLRQKKNGDSVESLETLLREQFEFETQIEVCFVLKEALIVLVQCSCRSMYLEKVLFACISEVISEITVENVSKSEEELHKLGQFSP